MGLYNGMTLTIMSDRQKRLIVACATEFFDAHIRYCARHVYANFQKKFSEVDLRKKFWKATKGTNQLGFNIVIESIKFDDKVVHK